MVSMSSKYPYILRMLGWSRKSWIFISWMSCRYMSFSLSDRFWMDLRATRKLVVFYWAR